MSHRSGVKGRPDAILIAGPTASGKSALAMRVAERTGGLVINADSMQVYRDLRIITARPGEADERRVPHALFGHVDGGQTYSVTRWLADVSRELGGCTVSSPAPIFVGGTGLYFKALTQGLSDIPEIPPAVRREVRDWADGKAPDELHAALAARDPATAARLRPTDPQRLVRALEVLEATGRSLASFQTGRQAPLLDVNRCVAVYLAPDRAELGTVLDRRFDRMMSDGALTEVARLSDRKLDPTLPIMRALGIPPLLRHLAGTLDLQAAVARAKADTRRYVKRQETFARHQLAGFRPIATDGADDAILARIYS